MREVIVLGAGVVGAAVAYRLSRADVRVTVLEARRPAALASRRSFAWINASNKLPRVPRPQRRRRRRVRPAGGRAGRRLAPAHRKGWSGRPAPPSGALRD